MSARRLAVAVLVASFVACGRGEAPSSSPARATATGDVTFPSERVTVRFGQGAEVRAEVAVTPAQLGRGLMFRTELGADDGMLFLLPALGTQGFYMKNTLIPLSIAYMRRTADRTYRVVAILDMEPCPQTTVDCPTYPPDAYYDATVEVNQGWFDRHGVKVGATARVDGPLPAPLGTSSPAP